MRFVRRKSLLLGALGGSSLLGAALVINAILSSHFHQDVLASSARAAPADPQERESSAESISVKTVHPRRDPSFSLSVEQPAYVAAYYQANLMAQVAGPVKSIVHDIGDKVKAGEVLVQIAVPDLEEDVRQKDALVFQQEKELDLARAQAQIAEKTVAQVQTTVDVKRSEIDRVDATTRFRQKELDRFKGLGTGPSPAVTQDIIDERTEFYEAAAANSKIARMAVKEAEAKLEEARAKLEAARADINKQDAMLRVARKNRDRAQVQLDFATILAPFDGAITRRNVDPGSFIQNATTGNTPALLTIARTDIVTVYMKVPDNYAPFVKAEDEAVIQMDALPGVMIRGKVTRSAQSLETPENDRTMRVEVDLYNGDAAQYQAFLAKEKATHNADLKSRRLPVFPEVVGKEIESEPLGLLPGQYGKMRLILRSFQKAYLLPTSAVFNRGGTSYVFLVIGDQAVRVPVRMQADNGKMVKVALIEHKGNDEIVRELTGKEEVVLSNQGELSNGQAVKTTPVDW